MTTKLALVQGRIGNLVIRVADSIDELLEIEFRFNPSSMPPRIHRVSEQCLKDETGAALVAEVEQQMERGDYKALRIP